MKLKIDANGNAVLQDGMPVYIKDDGTEIEFDAAKAFSKISQLTGENRSHRERAEAAEGKLAAFKDIADPVEAVKAIATVKNLKDKQLVDAGEVEKVKAEAIAAVEEKYAPIVKKSEELESQLNRHLIGGAFARSKFIAEKFAAEGPAGVEIAEALFGSRLKVEGGKVVGYDANGAKLYSRSRPGELADPDEAIELLVDSYPHKASILKGSGSSGSGSSGSSNGGGGKKTIPRAQFDQLDPAGRMAHVKAGGVVTD